MFVGRATSIARCRVLSQAFASRRVVAREQGATNRLRQDKSRKVRPVGRMRRCSNFSEAANIAKIRRNVPLLPRGSHGSTFHTLR